MQTESTHNLTDSQKHSLETRSIKVNIEPKPISFFPEMLNLITDVTFDPSEAIRYDCLTFNVTNVSAMCPISTVHVTSLLLEKHVMSSFASTNTVCEQKRQYRII